MTGGSRRGALVPAARPLGLLVGLAVAVTGCGRGPSPDGSDENPVAPDRITGLAPPSVRGFPSVVVFRPDDTGGVSQDEVHAGDTVLMDQIYMEFFPGLLVLRPGQTVEFRNSEPDAAHNVRVQHVPGDTMVFNVGVGQGIPYFHRFSEVGDYHVTCDIHPGMEAALLVTDAPHFVMANDDGTFALDLLPPGSYSVETWSMNPELRLIRVLDLLAEPVHLDLTRPG